MASFADRYSKEQFAQLLAARDSPPRGDDGKIVTSGPAWLAWAEERTRLEAPARQAVAGHLKALAAAGALREVRGVESRQIDLGLAWNSLVRGEAGASKIDDLADVVMRAAMLDNPELDEDADRVGILYRRFIERMDSGSIEAWRLGFGSLFSRACRLTGERFEFALEGWGMVMGRMASKGEFVPVLEETPPLPIIHEVIPVPSGKFLVVDWFRIPGFSEAAKKVERNLSVNTASGKIETTQRFARELGILHVFVGNTCPGIHAGDGIVMVGYDDEDQPPSDRFQAAGSVCTDLWWTTGVDRSVLEAILAKERGISAQQAAEEVGELIDESASPITVLDLEPGQYHLYAGPDYESFGADFCSPDFEIPKGYEPYLLLSSKSLRLTPAKPATKTEDKPKARMR